ncbi:MAG TPA: TIGR03668 family PPOX class F420-dependent oxidoreductase [Streptosporangiaceae bacterium]|nr:TIGR03668 family PPOX class F420-dependent oxidoreductase [Streptosporangiaceae bacterium]
MPPLEPDEARRLFSSARVARLATVAGGTPHVVPFTFAVDGDVVYTAVDAKPKSTTNLKRLSNIRDNPRVAVLADHYEDDWSTLWWVRADGTATVVSDAEAMERPVRMLAERYPQYVASPPGGPLIVIRVHRWTGWSAR